MQNQGKYTNAPRRPAGFSTQKQTRPQQETPQPQAQKPKKSPKPQRKRTSMRRQPRRINPKRILLVLLILAVAALVVCLIANHSDQTVHMLPEIRDIETQTSGDFVAEGVYVDSEDAQ